MNQAEKTERVILVCGTCDRKRTIQKTEWEQWKKRREQSGTVILCDFPSIIPKSKNKCKGVLHELSEAFWHKKA